MGKFWSLFLGVLGIVGMVLAIAIPSSEKFPLWMKILGGIGFFGTIFLALFYRAERKNPSKRSKKGGTMNDGLRLFLMLVLAVVTAIPVIWGFSFLDAPLQWFVGQPQWFMQIGSWLAFSCLLTALSVVFLFLWFGAMIKCRVLP